MAFALKSRETFGFTEVKLGLIPAGM